MASLANIVNEICNIGAADVKYSMASTSGWLNES
jgi:hypothetical protein